MCTPSDKACRQGNPHRAVADRTWHSALTLLHTCRLVAERPVSPAERILTRFTEWCRKIGGEVKTETVDGVYIATCILPKETRLAVTYSPAGKYFSVRDLEKDIYEVFTGHPSIRAGKSSSVTVDALKEGLVSLRIETSTDRITIRVADGLVDLFV